MSSSPHSITSELNPRTTRYEFLGPPGALAITLGVPAAMYAMYFGCSDTAGGCPPAMSGAAVVASLASREWWVRLWDARAAFAYLAWYAFTLAAWVVLPGAWVEGVRMRDGRRKRYKMNAFATMLLALAFAGGAVWRYGPHSLAWVYERWVGLLTASTLFAFVLAGVCYAASFRAGALLALGGNTGNFIYDFFIGRELNPSVGAFDLKSFHELRPGLILWALVDVSMACAQAVRRGGHGVTDSMALVVVFQVWYVADSLYNEPAVLTTMDITTDGFGFMLAIAATLEPFVYSLQARYLVFNPVELGPVRSFVIFAVNLLGYYIFRASNGEKNDFRNGRNPKNLQYMTTESGRHLLTSGWWGRCRHPNYMGDLIMALAWSLPTGFITPITYFYVIYFTILLVHREKRDDEACQKKYGRDWDKYKKLVPWRIFPYIY